MPREEPSLPGRPRASRRDWKTGRRRVISRAASATLRRSECLLGDSIWFHRIWDQIFYYWIPLFKISVTLIKFKFSFLRIRDQFQILIYISKGCVFFLKVCFLLSRKETMHFRLFDSVYISLLSKNGDFKTASNPLFWTSKSKKDSRLLPAFGDTTTNLKAAYHTHRISRISYGN